jgi:hypothetical protein
VLSKLFFSFRFLMLVLLIKNATKIQVFNETATTRPETFLQNSAKTIARNVAILNTETLLRFEKNRDEKLLGGNERVLERFVNSWFSVALAKRHAERGGARG